MLEVINYLNDNDHLEPIVAMEKIKNQFDISNVQAVLIYKSWREDFLKPKFEVKGNKRGRPCIYV